MRSIIGWRNVRRKRDWSVSVCGSVSMSNIGRLKARRFVVSGGGSKSREVKVISNGYGTILGSMPGFAAAMTSVVENGRAENLFIDLGEMRGVDVSREAGLEADFAVFGFLLFLFGSRLVLWFTSGQRFSFAGGNIARRAMTGHVTSIAAFFASVR